MKKPWPILIATLLLWLAACQPAQAPSRTAPAATQAAPSATAPTATLTAAVIPTQETPTMSPTPDTASAYPPAPSDKDLGRGKFFVDAFNLAPQPDKPGYFTLSAEGSLPTPCHLPRVTVRPPDANHQIVVAAYSVVPKDQMCTQVLKPFSGKLAQLGGYPSGTYTVKVNDLPAKEIQVP